MTELTLNWTDQGVCPMVIVILGRRGIGKTTLLQALAPLLTERPEQAPIVSPLQTLKARMPAHLWYEIHVSNVEGIDKLFRGFLNDSVQRHVLADEADELTAANAAGTAGGFVSQAVYDYINYGREQGLGITLSSRRPSNIAKDITANANLVFVGNTTDPYALDYYNAWMHDPTQPEMDWREKCQVLPTIERYGYSVFMAWEPGRKFLGYVTVDTSRMQLRDWDPSELPEGDQDVLGANDTELSTTTDTNDTERGSAPAPVSAARSVTAPSRTGPGPGTAPSTGER